MFYNKNHVFSSTIALLWGNGILNFIFLPFQWTRVFACIALIMSICISVFLLFGKSRQRPWAKERSAAEEEKEAERDEVAVHLEKF